MYTFIMQVARISKMITNITELLTEMKKIAFQSHELIDVMV